MSDQPQMTVIDPSQHPDSLLRAQYECYGVMWTKDVPECVGCLIRDRCITIIAKSYIPSLRKEHSNPNLSAAEIVEITGSDEESTQILFQIGNGKKITDLLPPQALFSDPPPAQPPTPMPDPAPIVKAEAKKPKKAAPVKPAKKAKPVVAAALAEPAPLRTIVVVEETPPVPEAVAVSGKPVDDAPSPKKAKKEAVVKKQPAQPKAAKPVKAAAPKKMVKPPAVTPAKKPAAKPLGADDFAARWERERARSPQVAALKPGHVFKREYKEKTHEVRYDKGFVEYLGKKFPSLAAVMTEIVEVKTFARADGGKRKMTDWSVARFFQLSKPLQKKFGKKKKKTSTKK